MDIVRKTARDMVPKAIKLYIIDEVKKYIDTELMPSFFDKNVNLVSIQWHNICFIDGTD